MKRAALGISASFVALVVACGSSPKLPAPSPPLPSATPPPTPPPPEPPPAPRMTAPLALAPGERAVKASLFGTDVIGLPSGAALTPDAAPGAKLFALDP